MRNNKFVAIILVPVFIHLCIFIIGPIIGGFLISFMNYNPLRSGNIFVQLDNYKKLVVDPRFSKALKNTLFFVFVTVSLNITISLIFANLISSFKSNGTRSLFRMVFFLPCVAPLVASSVVWGRSIFPTSNGLLNMFLTDIGLSAVNWLGDANVLMWSIILFTIWVDIGYNIIIFSAGLDGIPEEFYEAASIDGAGPLTCFFYITIPLLRRTLSFVIVMTLISHFQMFAQFDVMVLKSGPQDSGLVLTSYIYKTAFEYKNMGYASAISMMLFFIILGFTIIERGMNKIDWEY